MWPIGVCTLQKEKGHSRGTTAGEAVLLNPDFLDAFLFLSIWGAYLISGASSSKYDGFRYSSMPLQGLRSWSSESGQKLDILKGFSASPSDGFPAALMTGRAFGAHGTACFPLTQSGIHDRSALVGRGR